MAWRIGAARFGAMDCSGVRTSIITNTYPRIARGSGGSSEENPRFDLCSPPRFRLEPFIHEWKRFDGMDFACRGGEDRSAMVPSREDFDAADAERTPKRKGYPFEIKHQTAIVSTWSLAYWPRRAGLTVFTPLRPTLLASPQATRVQTIPFADERL